MWSSSYQKLPLSRAFIFIFLWTLGISGSALMGWLYYLHLKELRAQDNQYRIIAIVQSNLQREGLKTIYLAELLELSLDQPINLYKFDTQAAAQKLLSSPLIKEVSVKKIRPGTLYIEYQMRVPVAYLGDYTNTAIDAEGYLFPFSPFFTPKYLPIFYLGIEKIEKEWGSSLKEDPYLQLAFKLTQSMQIMYQNQNEPLDLKTVDVSQAFADSYGQRQIVMSLEEPIKNEKGAEGIQTHFVRLNADNYLPNLANYQVVRKQIKQLADMKVGQPLIIDLRIPHLAFIQK